MNDTPQPSKKRSWVRWVLVASLAVNVAIIGIIIGSVLNDNQRPPVIVGGNDGLRGLVRALPEAQRSELRELFRDRQKSVTTTRENFRSNRRELLTALRQQDINEAALRDIFMKRADLVHTVTTDGYDLIVGVLADMPFEERLEFIERLQNPPNRDRKPPQRK